MMTIARWNRRWTKELRATLVTQVNEQVAKGLRKSVVFRKVSPQWGMTANAFSQAYYKSVHEAKTVSYTTQILDGVSKNEHKLVTVSVAPNKIATIILALNKAGVAARKINVTF